MTVLVALFCIVPAIWFALRAVPSKYPNGNDVPPAHRRIIIASAVVVGLVMLIANAAIYSGQVVYVLSWPLALFFESGAVSLVAMLLLRLFRFENLARVFQVVPAVVGVGTLFLFSILANVFHVKMSY